MSTVQLHVGRRLDASFETTDGQLDNLRDPIPGSAPPSWVLSELSVSRLLTPLRGISATVPTILDVQQVSIPIHHLGA